MAAFKGFSKKFPQFFEELKANNSKAWFDAHRSDYDNTVVGPAREFVTAMGEILPALAPQIAAIPKVNQSLFRINRDTRFSPDKSPYKTHMGIWFWEGERKRMECSGFYMHFGDGALMLGCGIHMFPKSLLNPYRDAVVDKKLGSKLVKAVEVVAGEGYQIGGEHYKRLPRGYEATGAQADLLCHNGLAAWKEEPLPDVFFTPEIVTYAFGHFQKMQPLHRWLREALG